MQLTLEFTILLGHQNILTRPIEHYNSVHRPTVDLSKSTKPSDTSKLAPNFLIFSLVFKMN